jgi:hypothetical protein
MPIGVKDDGARARAIFQQSLGGHWRDPYGHISGALLLTLLSFRTKMGSFRKNLGTSPLGL